jgi:PAS domain S-box-containing protein
MTVSAQRMQELLAVNRAIVSTLEYDEVLQLVVEKTATFTNADACALLLLDDQRQELRVAASLGIDADKAKRFVVPLNERMNTALRTMLGFGEEDTFLGVPIIHQGTIEGVLFVYRSAHGSLDSKEELLLSALADQAAIAIAHARSYGEVIQAREQQARLLETIQSNTTTYLVYLDSDLRFKEVNAAYCRASRRSREELIGRTYAEMFPGGSIHASLKRVRASGEAAELRDVPSISDPSGATRWWDWSVQPIRSPVDGIEGLVLSAVDTTEKVRALAALENASRHKDEFLAMLAHELRNPLSAIASAMEVLSSQLPDDPLPTRARTIASRQVKQMKRLLDDLLDVSRLTSGKISLERRTLDLRTVVEQAVESSMPLVSSKRHQLSIQLPPDPVSVEGDSHRLVQVVSNLLTNAANYTKPEGQIQLAVRRVGQSIELRVHDNGVGITPEFLPQMFDLFVQGTRTLGRTEGGLGIGLTVVDRLVKMHGGEVEARSAGLGHGSEFIVRLPALCPPDAAVPKLDGPGPGRAPKRRILLIEDNADAADMLAALLEIEGHEVVIAGDGPRALELAQRWKPDIVLLDVGLPGMDGYEVARRLRALELDPRPRIAGLSGYGRAEDREQAEHAGMDLYLVKPIDREKLENLLT